MTGSALHHDEDDILRRRLRGNSGPETTATPCAKTYWIGSLFKPEYLSKVSRFGVDGFARRAAALLSRSFADLAGDIKIYRNL